MSAEKPRQIAVRVLHEHARQAGFLEPLLETELAKTPLSGADRGLLQELVRGVIRWQATLDWLVQHKTDGRTQTAYAQILLHLGLYQMFWLDRVPDHAAINETVELAKELKLGAQAGFINAILRGYQRDAGPTREMLADLKLSQPALGYSHPDWLCQRWIARWGAEKVRALLEWNNTPPPVYARLNALRADAATLAAQFDQEGVRYKRRSFHWVPDDLVFELESHPSLTTLKSFQLGYFYVQDPSTLLAVSELDPQPGQSVLDYCAAPGGKTTYIAQLMRDQGAVMAQDLDVRRRNLIRENCARLGVRCVNISRATSSVHDVLSEPFDRILVDAPCSNTGVMRRRVEVRWRVQLSELERLRGVQFESLIRAARQLKPGGVLVYSTCSLEPEENGELVRQFLTTHPDLRLERERDLLPFVEGVDGAYIARLVRAGR